jgi:N-methylhydantoinase A
MSYIIGVDIGGTFTDCVVIDAAGSVTIAKAPSTPPDFEVGFVDSIRNAAEELGKDLRELIGECQGIYHGCTVGTNALVEGKGVSVALLTTRGHRDSIFFMQSGRRLRALPHEYVASVARHRKPEPLVPKQLVGELDERITFDGNVLAELNADTTRETVARLLEQGAAAFAISLLWSVANDDHERAVEAIVREMAPDAFVSVASRIVPRTGEYERTVATVINAVVGPVMDRYLGDLESLLGGLGYHAPVQVMTCSGGLITATEARALPVLTIGSGPVAGVIGSLQLTARDTPGQNGWPARVRPGNVITADMGGTTLDVGVIHEGTPLSSPTAWHGQYEYFVPTLDVRSIGAGGGSIIAYDEHTETLSVGPESAGARPGPACYGHGGDLATTTDADLLLGYLSPSDFAAGTMSLDVEAARSAVGRVGEPLAYDAAETAAAAVRIVDSQMADAIRLASIEQGYDPREFTLYAYGGAGPIHAAAIAMDLGISRLVVPLSDLASGWSAFGVGGSDAMVVEELAVKMRDPFDADEFNIHWQELEERVRLRLTRQGIPDDTIRVTRLVDMRYAQQVNQVQVRAPDGRYTEMCLDELVEEYEREYARLFGEGTGYSKAGYAITLLRVEARARISSFELAPRGVARESELRPASRREVTFVGARTVTLDTAVFDGSGLSMGDEIAGPAIIEYPHTSVLVPQDARAYIDGLGSVVINVGVVDR